MKTPLTSTWSRTAPFEEVDREYAKALRQGAEGVMEPATEPWGQRTCYIADPEGNLIEIASFDRPFDR